MAARDIECEGGIVAKRLKTEDMNGDESGIVDSKETGAVKPEDSKDAAEFTFTDTTTLEDLRKLNEKFIKDRNWHQFHSPRNVLLALVGEVGELSEIFQWKGEVSQGLPELSEKEREHVGQEMSDILIYLIDLATRCHVDLPAAVMSKMAANARKYPVAKAYGKSNKYTDYQE